MPKPIFGINGSGMHTNMSLVKGGKNAFYDKNASDGLSDITYNFIAGLLKHVKAMTAVTNPLVNSYKRLVPGYEAPVYIAWSGCNRSPLVRIPASRGEGTRVELRCPDPSANPYLVMAVCLAAGLDGIKRNLQPPEAVNQNIYDMDGEQLVKRHRKPARNAGGSHLGDGKKRACKRRPGRAYFHQLYRSKEKRMG